MIQSGGSFGIFNLINLIAAVELTSKITNKAEDLSNKVTLNDPIIKTVSFSNNLITDFKKVFGTGITLKSHKIKYIMKIIKSLENWEIWLKGISRRLLVKKEDLLKPLITAG